MSNTSSNRAMMLFSPAPITSHPLKLVSVDIPTPREKEVLVRVHTCGICRTDLHVIEAELPPHTLPIIPGHQIIGTVEATGPGCTQIRCGQRVGIAWLRHVCGTCHFCLQGKENLCGSALYTGYDAHGGYTNYTVAPEDFVYPIPAVFDDITAAPLLCAGIIGFRALQRCNLPHHGILALYGFGSSAHIVFQLAQKRGHTIFVVSRSKNHQQMAREMGADWVGPNASDIPEKADGAIIFAPVGHLVPDALEHLQKGGTLALAGIYMTDIPSLQYERHLFYEREIRSVTANTRADALALLEEAATIPIQTRTTTYPLEQANQALIDLKSDNLSGSGVLLVSKK